MNGFFSKAIIFLLALFLIAGISACGRDTALESGDLDSEIIEPTESEYPESVPEITEEQQETDTSDAESYLTDDTAELEVQNVATGEIIPEITIRIPGSDALFTLINVSAEYVLATDTHWSSDEELPHFRFAFPGLVGKVRINQPFEDEIALFWVYADTDEIGFAGGGGRGVGVSPDTELAVLDWLEEGSVGMEVRTIVVNQDGTLAGIDSPAIALVSFYFGFPVVSESWEHINYPKDMISFEWYYSDYPYETRTMIHANLPKFPVLDLAHT